jgi:acyl dehydratase
MAVPNRFILHQGSVVAALGRSALAAALKRPSKALATSSASKASHPGPWIEQTIAPRSHDLVRCYVRHVGGDPSAYRRHLPPHLFPQWGFPLAARTLVDVDYPMQKVLNAGCRIEVNAQLPNDEPLRVRARIESIDDNGRRALIQQKVITGTAAEPEALVGHMFALVPLGGPKRDGKKRERARVPNDARELGFWKIGADAGLSFAKLTGDFNPVHWVPAYARAFGFKSCILHGFATMARAMEGLHRGLLSGDVRRVRMLDVQFTSPLLLPARVGLYLDALPVENGGRIVVGDAPGGRAYLTGSFELTGANPNSGNPRSGNGA